jgi:hypothetical protein
MVEGELSRGQRGSKYRDSPPEALYAPAEVRIEALSRLYIHQLKCKLIGTACKLKASYTSSLRPHTL